MTFRAAAVASTRTIFVGEVSGVPIIDTVDTADLGELAPTVTARTPNGPDSLLSVAHIATENITVAVGNNGRIEDSTDQGLNWNSQTKGIWPLYDVIGVSGDQSRFVVASYNSIWTQNQSAVWTQTWTGGQRWDGVGYLSGVGWVVVGQSGWAMHSPTGLSGSWGSKYQIATTTLARVRANGSEFMAVGQSGKIFRSATGLSGSWTEVSLTETPNLYDVTPLAASNEWAIIDSLGYTWYSFDNGATWTKNPTRSLVYGAAGLAISPGPSYTYALAVGGRGNFHVSFDQIQADYVAPDPNIDIEPGAAFGANSDMSGDAVKRFVTQFRSGRG